MKFTLFGTSRETGNATLSNVEFGEFINNMGHESQKGYIAGLRQYYHPGANRIDRYAHYDQIRRVCPVAEWRRGGAEPLLVQYNRMAMLEVENLNSRVEVDAVKAQASLMPQTVAAFMGCDAHSVVILVAVSTPDGHLPQTEEELENLVLQAYYVAVQTYSTMLPHPISIRRQTLQSTFLQTVDTSPYVNHHALPLVVNPMSREAINQMLQQASVDHRFDRLRPGMESIMMMEHIYNRCHHEALIKLDERGWRDNPMAAVVMIAQHCKAARMPEEEATYRIMWHFYKLEDAAVRNAVHTVYEDPHRLGITVDMPKKQLVALQLPEFLNRRYDIRYNTMTETTEFRIRNSFDFNYREMTKRDRNTICHEAAKEGIEAFISEINGLIDSTFVRQYNPMTDYLNSLEQWDGQTDYIGRLADRVKCDHPQWKSLFRLWFLSMVAHWQGYDDTHGNSLAPILVGEQGFRKSTFCRMILPPELSAYYTDRLDFSNNNEAERRMTRYLLINIDEFDQLSAPQMAFVKYLATANKVDQRRAYSSVVATRRRYASFIGTTNDQEVLRIVQGTRRFICTRVLAPIDTETPLNHRQLYAQALHLIANDARYWANDTEEMQITLWNKQFIKSDPIDLILSDLFEPYDPAQPHDSELQPMKLTDIMAVLRTHRSFNSKLNNLVTLGRCMRQHNIPSIHKADGMYYYVRQRKQ